jgi:hypothetical protein
MVKRFSWQNKELFAGCVAYFGGGNRFEDEGRDPKLPPKPPPPPGPASETRLEYYIVHGDKDDQVNVSASRECTADLKQKGYRYVYREILGGDHGNVWPIPDVRDDAIAFLHSLRSKEIPLAADDKKYLASVKSKSDLFGQPGTVSEISRIGGAVAGHILSAAFDQKAEDVRQLAAETAQKTLYGREIALELIKLTGDKVDAVKEAAYRALGTFANWRYEEAQQFLIQKAMKRSLKVEERRLAAEAITKACRLQLHAAAPEDKQMVWTLVFMLEDDDANVREVALACLKVAVKDGFDFKPQEPPSGQKDSIAKAKSWANKALGPFGGPGKAAKSP